MAEASGDAPAAAAAAAASPGGGLPAFGPADIVRDYVAPSETIAALEKALTAQLRMAGQPAAFRTGVEAIANPRVGDQLKFREPPWAVQQLRDETARSTQAARDIGFFLEGADKLWDGGVGGHTVQLLSTAEARGLLVEVKVPWKSGRSAFFFVTKEELGDLFTYA